MKTIIARANAALDRWSAKYLVANVVISTGRTVVVGVKLLVRDTRQVVRDSGAAVETYAMAERRARVKRDLLIGLPLAVYFNIPIGDASTAYRPLFLTCCMQWGTRFCQLPFSSPVCCP
jgi:hypothetical protein